MRPRIKKGALMGSSNDGVVIMLKYSDIDINYVPKIFGNKIISREVKDRKTIVINKRKTH